MATLSSETISAVCLNINCIETTYDEYKLSWKCLNDQRLDGVFCDVLIKCCEHTFYAHKGVLASVSRYFKRLFLSPLSTNEYPHIVNLDHFSKENIQLVLDIIYFQRNVDTADLQELLRLVDYFQYDWLADMLLEAIRSIINDNNCVAWYKIAEESGIEKLAILAEKYIRINYERLFDLEMNRTVLIDTSVQLTLRKSIYDKEIAFCYQGTDGYVVDVLKKTCDKYSEGPLCMSKLLPEIEPPALYYDFHLLIYFTFRKQLYVVYKYTYKPGDDTDSEAQIEVRKYNQCSKDYELPLSIDPYSYIYGDEFDDDQYDAFEFDFCFWIKYIALYVNEDNFYTLWQSVAEQENLLVYKFDLTNGWKTKKYFTFKVEINATTKFVFTNSNVLGTILVLDIGQIYKIDSYSPTENNCPVDKLEILTYWKKSTYNNRETKMWYVVSLNGNVFYFAVFENETLTVLKLDVEKLCWVHFFECPISGYLNNVFCCQNKIFIVLSTCSYENYCTCRYTSCELQHYNEHSNISTELKCFDVYKRTMIPANITLPAGKPFQFSVVPGHVLV